MVYSSMPLQKYYRDRFELIIAKLPMKSPKCAILPTNRNIYNHEEVAKEEKDT